MDFASEILRIRHLSDEQLIDLLLHREDYRREVVEVSEAEFNRRKLPFDRLVEAQEEADIRQAERLAYKEELSPLEARYEQLISWLKEKLKLED